MFLNTALSFSIKEFEEYLSKQPKPLWIKAITVHHTASPSLIQRPQGLSPQHLINLRSFYQSKGWQRGPQLFVDDKKIHILSDIQKTGIHAVSHNSFALGIEVLGDYDKEDPFKGRGLEAWKNTAQLLSILFRWLNLPVNDKTLLFHRDDPKTNKTCPGTRIEKKWLLDLINQTPSSKPTARDSSHSKQSDEVEHKTLPKPPLKTHLNEPVKKEEKSFIQKIFGIFSKK